MRNQSTTSAAAQQPPTLHNLRAGARWRAPPLPHRLSAQVFTAEQLGTETGQSGGGVQQERIGGAAGWQSNMEHKQEQRPPVTATAAQYGA